MEWKEFLKPSIRKIALTLFMLLALNLLFWLTWQSRGACGEAQEGFALECVPAPSYILRVTLLSFIPFYLVACLVIYIREKQKLEKK